MQRSHEERHKEDERDEEHDGEIIATVVLAGDPHRRAPPGAHLCARIRCGRTGSRNRRHRRRRCGGQWAARFGSGDRVGDDVRGECRVRAVSGRSTRAPRKAAQHHLVPLLSSRATTQRWGSQRGCVGLNTFNK